MVEEGSREAGQSRCRAGPVGVVAVGHNGSRPWWCARWGGSGPRRLTATAVRAGEAEAHWAARGSRPSADVWLARPWQLSW